MQHCHHQWITQDYTCIVLQLNYICTYIKNYVLLKITNTHTHTHTHTHIHTHTNTHIHKHTYEHTQTYIHTHKHTNTHTHTHTKTHTHKHIHTLNTIHVLQKSFTLFTHGSHKTYRGCLQGFCTVSNLYMVVY